MKSTCGIQGTGFHLSEPQPKDDPRPYLQYIMYAALLGGDAENFDVYANAYSFDEEVNDFLSDFVSDVHSLSEFDKTKLAKHSFLNPL